MATDSTPATATPASAAAAPAQLAKAALRRIAQQRQEPTPLNFAKAWREEGGAPPALAELGGPSRNGLNALVARVLPGADAARRERLALALAAGRFDQLAALLDEPGAAATPSWSELIERAVRGVERGNKQWTTARKKDSLQRVLGANRSDSQRLQQRLSQLLASWDSDAPPGDAAAEAAAGSADDTDVDAGADAGLDAGVDAVANPGDDTPRSGSNIAGMAGVDDGGMPVGAATQGDQAEVGAEAAAAMDVAPWLQIVDTLQATVQVALPAEDARAREVAEGLRALTRRLAAPASAAEVVGAKERPASGGEPGGAEGTGPLAEADGAIPTPPGAATLTPQAVAEALGEACAEAQRVLQHRHHLVEQLGRLVSELTEGLGDLAEDDSWVRGQCEAMHGQLDDGLTVRGVRSVSDLLRTTRLRQQQLRGERAQARDALKQLIHQMLQDIGELGETTGRFHDSVGRYADAIGSADSLESLAGTVREMVEETRAVHDIVSQTQQRLQSEHARATELSQRVQALEDEIRRLSDEVGTDQLTQVANRRGLMTQFEAERARAERAGTSLAVALLDIDNFKKLNDTLGHATGDEALKFLSRRVKELLRPTDALARFGGEEFVVLLPATDVEEAQTILTRVQRQLSAEFFMHENKQTFITFSAGTTAYRGGETLEQALQRADEALYEAKRTGKNRTCMA